MDTNSRFSTWCVLLALRSLFLRSPLDCSPARTLLRADYSTLSFQKCRKKWAVMQKPSQSSHFVSGFAVFRFGIRTEEKD